MIYHYFSVKIQRTVSERSKTFFGIFSALFSGLFGLPGGLWQILNAPSKNVKLGPKLILKLQSCIIKGIFKEPKKLDKFW